MVAGAPFFFGVGDGEGVALEDGLSEGVSVAVGEGDGVSVGVGDGDGDAFFFFLPGEAVGEGDGVGVGEAFFLFAGEAAGASSDLSAGVGVPVSFFFFAGVGVGDFSGVAFGEGDFSATEAFFVVPELLRFRGAGVGVGAKIFFSLVPSDSAARAFSPVPVNSAITQSRAHNFLPRRMRTGQ